MHTPNLKLIEGLLFQIMVGNPLRTAGRMDGRALTIPMSPPDFIGRDNKILLKG